MFGSWVLIEKMDCSECSLEIAPKRGCTGLHKSIKEEVFRFVE